VSDFIRHGQNGLLVADDAGMTDAIVALAGSAQLRAALTAHEQGTETGFCWDSVLLACARVYASAFEQQGLAMPALRPALRPVLRPAGQVRWPEQAEPPVELPAR
jgi:hypothetical protein